MKERVLLKRTLLVSGAILLFLSFFILSVMGWIFANYGDLALENILFQLAMSSEGADPKYFITFVGSCILLPLFYLLLCLLPVLFKKVNQFSFRFRKRDIYPFQLWRCLLFPVGLILFVYSIYHANTIFNIKNYIAHQRERSTFIAEHYVDPRSVNVAFPKEKRNLIYINLESMENTYMSKQLGGARSTNLIPALSDLANQYICFSQNNGIGGAFETFGGRNTISSTISQTAGVPLKIPFRITPTEQKTTYLPNAVTIGDVLHKNGYNQVYLQGSDSVFAGTGLYFRTHGNYRVYDLAVAEKEHKEKEPINGWGLKDYEVYAIAKEQLLTLAKEKQPFNLTMFTMDTHTPEGRLCPLCEDKYPTQYENVVACASKQVGDFVHWIQQQDFYRNTTIVIVGDHPTMMPNFFENLPSDYVRRTYNVMINSVIRGDFTKNRSFSKMDLFPTTLAGLGATIDGDRLALGTNLFSGKKTLIEEFGFKKFNDEMEKKSLFYENQLSVKK